MKKLLICLAMIGGLAGCERASDVASHNISVAGDNFEINRSIHFMNTRTDRELMRIEGLCAKDNSSTDKTLIITCKTGPGAFKKHYLGLSMNLGYFIEQLDPLAASDYHYRVIFAPGVIIPNLELR